MGGAWPASSCPEPQGAVACSPAASPRARVQDSLWAIVAPFLPLCLALPFLGERLDQGEVELEPRGVRERAQLGPGRGRTFSAAGAALGAESKLGRFGFVSAGHLGHFCISVQNKRNARCYVCYNVGDSGRIT